MRRPGGNTTGVSLLAPELDGKRQDLIMETVPGIRRIAALSKKSVTCQRGATMESSGAIC
jgi:putative ABC transport system substrate-binding protein